MGDIGYVVKGGVSLEMERSTLTGTLLMFLIVHLAHEL